MKLQAKSISYKPTDSLSYDPNEETYWDVGGLDKEVRRVFEVCHGCRMCFKYCDSFPTLFRLIDEQYEGDVNGLTAPEVDDVMDHCFQCKLCEVQCPYTPREQHEFQLDFPRLVHRYQAVRSKRRGLDLRERLTGNPDGTAKMARLSFGLANALNKVAAHRWLMEMVLGIHRDKDLPEFSRETFEAWAIRAGRMELDGEAEAVLFQTCYVQHNEPDLGRDTLRVMDKNQVRTICQRGQVCCGMPAWEHGDLASLRKNAKHNLDLLTPMVDAGAKVVVINPTCSMMLRREYPELVDVDDRERAAKVASAVVDTGELLWSIRKEERFCTDFKSTPKDVAYHAPCHLRAQAVGFKGRDLLRKIPGVSPRTVMECCGHDGTFAMRSERFEESKRVGAKAFSGMQDANAEVWVTECPLAATQFGQHSHKKAMHPMTVLARAYEPDGFPTKVGTEE